MLIFCMLSMVLVFEEFHEERKIAFNSLNLNAFLLEAREEVQGEL